MKKLGSVKALPGPVEASDPVALALAAQGPLVGRTVRLVSPELPPLQWNRQQKVAKHWAATGIVELEPDCRHYPETSLYCLTGTEAPAMPAVTAAGSQLRRSRQASQLQEES